MENSHVFICCDRGDHLAWLEACWFAEQDLDVWCEDGVNPGTPDWDECSSAIRDAGHRIFLITNRFVNSPDSVGKLQFAIESGGQSIAVLLEQIDMPTNVSRLVSHCIVVDKVRVSLTQYRDELGRLLRHTFNGAPQVAGKLSDDQSSGYTLGEWRVYPQLLRIECGAESKTLDRKLFDVLSMLVNSAPSVVTIEELLDEVWTGTIVGDNSIHRAISRLRKAFRDDPKNPAYIETIAKSGYRLVCSIGTELIPHMGLENRIGAPCYVQLKVFDGIGEPGSAELALVLTTDIERQLAATEALSVMPRSDRLADPQRRPKFVIAGLVQVYATQVSVTLELDDVVAERIVWSERDENVCPTSLSEQTQLANQLVGKLLTAISAANSMSR